jgi:beta-1,4-N-acetylglucosaminyltransferase
MYRILERFPSDEFRFAYAYGHNCGVHGAARLPMPHPGPRSPIRYLGQTRKSPNRYVANTARFLASLVEGYHLVSRLRPQAVLTLGSATAIGLCLAARCLRIPCVFVESLTRVRNLSLTGRILYHLRLTDRLYVQWPHLRKRYAKATFAGGVL